MSEKSNLDIKKRNTIIDYLKISLEKNRRIVTTLNGYSMKPTIMPNQKVEIIFFPFEDLCIGDIIAFRYYRNHITIHRIVEILHGDEKLLITKGDHNENNDPYFVNENVYFGKVIV